MIYRTEYAAIKKYLRYCCGMAHDLVMEIIFNPFWWVMVSAKWKNSQESTNETEHRFSLFSDLLVTDTPFFQETERSETWLEGL
jgi:hypothetical protein